MGADVEEQEFALAIVHKGYVHNMHVNGIGGDARLKDVGWGDFLLALLLTPLLVLPVVASVYLVLFVLLDVSMQGVWYWYFATWLVTCTVEGFLLAAFYERRGYRVEYRWAWALVVSAILALIVVLFLAGTISSQVALELAAIAYSSLAVYFLLIMLTLVLSTRTKAPEDPARRKADDRRGALPTQPKRL